MLNLNLKRTLMSKSNKTETKQKITLLKNLNKRFDTIKKQTLKSNFNHMSGLHNQLKIN